MTAPRTTVTPAQSLSVIDGGAKPGYPDDRSS